MTKKTYILDTNVYLTNAKAIYEYNNHDILIPMKVLEELDKHKVRQDPVGQQARATIRVLDGLREDGSLSVGVRLGKGKGMVRTSHSDVSLLPEDLSPEVPDNRIMSTALKEMKERPNRPVIMVTCDVNMRVVCDALGLKCEGYDVGAAVVDSGLLYSGCTEMVVDESVIDTLYKEKVIDLPQELTDEGKVIPFPLPNEFVTLVSNVDEKKTALARHIEDGEITLLSHYKKTGYDIKAKNREQTFALELLMDPEVAVVSLVGKAGSGKTLCAIAAGLSQTINGKKSEYSRLIVSRPVQPLGKDIGFLPGTVNEKMLPWLTPIQDNLQFLLGNDKAMLEEFMDKGVIEIEALTYIRGRSIQNTFMIIDEAQNLSRHELKTIITRVGEGTKIVLTGDVEQIDNAFVNDVTNGLSHAVEKFKNSELAGHISLKKGERSAVATLAAEVL